VMTIVFTQMSWANKADERVKRHRHTWWLW
jgi:hypothetical protein